jgi:hypothetical protein
MGKRLSIFWLSSLIIISVLLIEEPQRIFADQVKILTPVEMKMSYADLESVEAEFHQANNIVSVKGRIKNISNSVIRGFISLHLMSSTGSVLQTFELPIKSHQPLNIGESVKFETVLPTTKSKDATQISIDFTKN